MKQLNIRWLLLMAWRDSRRNLSRLGLFISSIVLGIAALVAIYSFGNNLNHDINNQAATLLGADLSIAGNIAPNTELLKRVNSSASNRSEERSFASMLSFPKIQGSRLVQVKALHGEFPYYGELETSPASAASSFRHGRQALVDKTLMLQYHAAVGDSVGIGELKFAIAGALTSSPGQTGFSSTIAPTVYIPLSYLEKTGLSKIGSRIRYTYYYKIDASKTNIGRLVKQLDPTFEKEGLHVETIQSKKESTGKSFGDLTRFLSLVAFIALLLGCIGVASAVHIYVREKISSIAVLRCLGLKSSQAFLIYLFQIVGIGFIGSLLGTVLGSIIQYVLPVVFKDFLPVDVSTSLSWIAIAEGIFIGLVISILFALLPLVSIRNISPLNTLRLTFEEKSFSADPLKWMVYFLIFVFIAGFTWLQLNSLVETAFFMLSLLVAFLLLTGIAYSLMKILRKVFPHSWNYLWRQGFANLFRPNNQTIILMISIGLSTAFICTLFFVQGILIKRVSISSSGNQPNLILFDIQSKQKEAVAALTRKTGLLVLQQVPVVTMRLEEVNGLNSSQLRKDSIHRPSHEALTREYRVTYRDSLIGSEKIVSGKWVGHVGSLAGTQPQSLTGTQAQSHPDTPRISIAEDFARKNNFQLGDHLLFSVQGLPVMTILGSFRSIDWNGIQTNFLVVFPKGVLEEAPQFQVLLTRVKSSQQSAHFQQQIIQNFPNVSIIDLHLILIVLDAILKKIGFVIRFMSGFSILTGLVVLIASVRISKYQRIQESVLLRTLGASRRQILIITGLEYFFLGLLASITGIILALAASWALASFSFKAAFSPDLLPAFLLIIFITTLTIVIGLLHSRGILNKPPLETLRKDV